MINFLLFAISLQHKSKYIILQLYFLIKTARPEFPSENVFWPLTFGARESLDVILLMPR